MKILHTMFRIGHLDRSLVFCAEIKAGGGKVTREAEPVKRGTAVIAFVEDTDGDKIGLIQK